MGASVVLMMMLLMLKVTGQDSCSGDVVDAEGYSIC
jgi:hypothetical protein